VRLQGGQIHECQQGVLHHQWGGALLHTGRYLRHSSIQGAFKEDSRNIQERFKEHSRNMQGMFNSASKACFTTSGGAPSFMP
jgi:hypothetical protein